jgi:hypothetical protein
MPAEKILMYSLEKKQTKIYQEFGKCQAMCIDYELFSSNLPLLKYFVCLLKICTYIQVIFKFLTC